MKKFASLFLATVVTAAVLTGCGSTGTLPNSSGSGSSGSSSLGSSSLGSGSSSSGSGSSGAGSSIIASATAEAGYPDDDGYAEGRMGDTMHTYFFDFTVNSAYLCDEYDGYTPEDGNEIAVVDITIKNTGTSTLPMYDTDFQIQWNDTADDAFAIPVTGMIVDGNYYLNPYFYPDEENKENNNLSDQMLPDEYEIAINKSINGLLVYEVPAGNKDFSISYEELFSDNTVGDLFFVFFSADKQ